MFQCLSVKDVSQAPLTIEPSFQEAPQGIVFHRTQFGNSSSAPHGIGRIPSRSCKEQREEMRVEIHVGSITRGEKQKLKLPREWEGQGNSPKCSLLKLLENKLVCTISWSTEQHLF